MRARLLVPVRGDLKLTIDNGRVTLMAQDVPIARSWRNGRGVGRRRS